MDKTLYIMQGIPGSGKSTMAEMIRAQTGGTILSTDDFWYEHYDPSTGETWRGDVYKFDIEKLGVAHRWNQRRTIECMESATPVLIIDNTNITMKDARIYFDLAAIYGYEVQVISVQVPTKVAIERQKTRPKDRAIPWNVIERMADKMEILR